MYPSHVFTFIYPMKKLLFFLTTCLATATVGFAQVPAPTMQTTPATASSQKNPDQLIDRRAQYLSKELGLNTDQQARLQPILLAQRQQQQILREQRTTGGRRLGTAQDLKAAQAKFDEQFKTVFTSKQYTKFNLMRDKLRERRAAGQAQPQAD